MAILQTYPIKTTLNKNDLLVITDQDLINGEISNKTRSIRISTLGLGTIDGSGTAGKIPMWSDSNTLTNSQFESQASGVLDIPNYIRHIGDTGNFFGFGSTAASSEFLVYTEGSGSPLDQESLRIRPSGTAIKTNATTRLNTTVAGAIELYYAGSKKFETTATGSTLTGGLSLSDGTNNVTISIPTITTSYDLKMPASIGTASQVLKLPSTIGTSPYQLVWGDSSGGNVGPGTTNSVALFSSTSNIGDSIMKQFSGNDGSGFNDTYFQLAGTGGAWMGNIRLGSVGGVAGGDGYLLDSTGVRGSDGQVLTSTGFQSKWEDIPSTGLQIGTFANKTTTLSALNSSISFTSADNGTSVSVASTLSVGGITAKVVPYITSGGEFADSNLGFTDSTNMEIKGNLNVADGNLSIKQGADAKVSIQGPDGNAGGDYVFRLPVAPTAGNQVLKMPATLGSSPYQLEWDVLATGNVTGSGTTNTIPKWKSNSAELTNSSFKTDANDSNLLTGAVTEIDGEVQGGLRLRKGTDTTNALITLDGPLSDGDQDYGINFPNKPSTGGQVLSLPATLGSSPYNLIWADASSVTSTNNVTASANSLNLQGSSSTAPTFGAPLNINYAGKPASAADGTATAIHLDMTAWDGTGDNLPARGITCDLKRSTTALHINNADQPSAKPANFVNSSSVEVGSITCTSSATSYTTTSDYRIKENIVAMAGAIDRVKELKPSRFNFITEPDKIVDGFLAHEAQEVVPEAVVGIKDDLDNSGNDLLQSMDHSKIVPLLTGAIKELIARIEELEAK